MENNESQNNNFKEEVLQKIQEGHVAMRPKVGFTLRLIALILTAILTLIVSIVLCTYILFTIRLSNHDPLLDFGWRGFILFLHLFPWLLFIIDVILILLLEWLLRKFRFGYERPALYLLLGILALTVSVGLIIDRGTGLDDALLHRADLHELPGPFGAMYEEARESPALDTGICQCTITGINGTIITAYDDNYPGTAVLIVLPSNNPQVRSLMIGETIFVGGNVSSGSIYAFGVSEVHPSQ